MTTFTLVLTGLLGVTDARPPAAAPPEPGPRQELVIPFTWQFTERWNVEIRGYEFRHGLPPELPPGTGAEVIEAWYSPDLRPLFEKARGQDRPPSARPDAATHRGDG